MIYESPDIEVREPVAEAFVLGALPSVTPSPSWTGVPEEDPS